MKINRKILRQLIMSTLKESRYIVDDKGLVQRSDQSYKTGQGKFSKISSQYPKLDALSKGSEEDKRQAMSLVDALSVGTADELSFHEATALEMGEYKSVGALWDTCPIIINALRRIGDKFNSVDDWKPQQVPSAFPDEWYSDPSTNPKDVPWVVIITIDRYDENAVAKRFLGEVIYKLEFYPKYSADGTIYLDGIQIQGGPGNTEGYYESRHYDFTPDVIANQIVMDIYQDIN